MRLLYVVDNSFYDFKPQKPSLVTIRSIVIEHTLRSRTGIMITDTLCLFMMERPIPKYVRVNRLLMDFK